MALVDTFKKSLSAFPLGGGPVLVAVSGGADSMALLHLIHRAGVPCGVAYFDHHTRQGASAEDGRFVAETARALGLALHLGGEDIARLASERGESFEMVARRERYAFLIDTARAHGFVAIATGHHADDQAETVLLRLLRGSSPAGLAGISPRREEGRVAIVRPMLGLRHDEITAWLRTEGIAWREDVSNRDTDVLRNRVRHALLPLLARDFNPGITRGLTRLAHLQRMDNALLDTLEARGRRSCEEGPNRVCREAFRALDPALQFRCMARWIRRAGGDPDFDGVFRAVEFVLHGAPGRQIDLGQDAALYLGADHGVFAPLAAPEDVDVVIVPVPGEARGFGKRFQARLLDTLPELPLSEYCDVGRQVFDGAAVASGITIRRRRAGDRIRPLGMAGPGS